MHNCPEKYDAHYLRRMRGDYAMYFRRYQGIYRLHHLFLHL